MGPNGTTNVTEDNNIMEDTNASRRTVPAEVLARYTRWEKADSRPLGNGLINQTFLAEAPGGAKAVFQRLHHIFAPTVNQDIEAVTAHLASKGMPTPRLIRTSDGMLSAADEQGNCWRALTFVEGECLDRLRTPEQAREAGALTARFHAALADFQQPFVHVRPGVHDLHRHLTVLSDALRNHAGHRLFESAAPLADELLTEAQRLPDFGVLPDRTIHGDLKISNLLFVNGKGHCLIDLDTLARQKWVFEMGDALRSWCNRAGEDVEQARIDTELFQAAADGYFGALRGTGFPAREEAESWTEGLAYICLELTCRFLADSLNETYFGFDAARFPARGEHNLLRARGQWSLYRDVRRRQAELEAFVRGAFRGSFGPAA